FKSLSPRRIVDSATPVASETAVTPPQPSDRASTAAHVRRLRSPNESARSAYFCRIHSTTGLSAMHALSHNHPFQTNSIFTHLFTRSSLEARNGVGSSPRSKLKSGRRQRRRRKP